jgi:perosamine synthetase
MVSVLIESDFGRSRDEVIAALETRGIETRPFFVPLHMLPPYLEPSSCPAADRIADKGINLPSAPALSDSDIETVCSTLAGLAR